MSSSIPSDPNPHTLNDEAQHDSALGKDLGNIDRDGKNDHAVEPNVIDLHSSQFVDRSIQLKASELSHPESLTEHLTSPLVEKEVSQPDSPVLKIDDLAWPSENIPAPVSLNTVIEEPSQPVLSASASSSPLPSPRRISKMPALVDLTELTLHSPSSQIIGTPFATNSTRFEYPFPDTSSPSNPASGSNSPPLSSSALTFTNASGSSFPVISTSQSTSQISPPALAYSLSSSDAPSYNATHPKLKAQLNSPIPPSLRKKRWSLNLLGRRKSSFGSDDSAGTTASIDTVLSGPPQHVASPPSSPREEGGKQKA